MNKAYALKGKHLVDVKKHFLMIF